LGQSIDLGSGFEILLVKKEQARQVIENEYERLKLFNDPVS
jgi:hypothetical protein